MNRAELKKNLIEFSEGFYSEEELDFSSRLFDLADALGSAQAIPKSFQN